MSEIISLEKNYSTMRLLLGEQPLIENDAKNKYQTFLFLPEVEDRQGEGGLRAQAFYKKSQINKPLITIITVVFNCEKLEGTILSVFNQTYDNVEYIIIDGSSTDGTMDIIKKYNHAIDYWVSEKDSGIFCAMNKGAGLATGDYIYFLNAGDDFFCANTLSIIFDRNTDLLNYDHTLVLGNVMLTVDNEEFGLANRVGVNIPHQGAFVKKEVFNKIRFDETEKIFGDAIFWQSMKRKGIFRPLSTDIIVAQFPMDGVGSSPEFIWLRFNESKRLLLATNDYLAIARRYLLSLIGYGCYKLFGTNFYFNVYIKAINSLVRIRG